MSTSVNWLSHALSTIFMSMGDYTVGYCTGETIDENGVVAPVGEPVGIGGYVESNILPFDHLSIPAARDGSTQSVFLTNVTLIEWPTATAAQGTFSHVVLRNGYDPIVVAVVPLPGGPITVNAGDTPVINVGGLKITLSS